MDALAIADALAARYASGTLTPPTGYAAVRVSTARLPNATPRAPFVLVSLPSGQVVLGSSQVDHQMDFEVTFHYAKASGDLARDMAGMLAWLAPLLGATYGQMRLGIAGVKKAYPTGYKLIVATYAGEEYYAWQITVRVDLNEAQVFTP